MPGNQSQRIINQHITIQFKINMERNKNKEEMTEDKLVIRGRLRDLHDPNLEADIEQELKDVFGHEVSFLCGWIEDEDVFELSFGIMFPRYYTFDEFYSVPKPCIDWLMKSKHDDHRCESLLKSENQWLVMHCDFIKHYDAVNCENGGSEFVDMDCEFDNGFTVRFKF